MAKKDLSGKRLERLVAMLEGIFAGANATIEAPCRRLIDRDTGKAREHDVVITWDHGHHRIVTAVECRDRSRPVGVPAVEGFADKCNRTGVHSGVIVSATGFAATARKKAEARSITCMELSEVERFDWMGIETVVGYQRRFDEVDLQIMFQERMPGEIAAIYDRNGNELTHQQIAGIVTRHVESEEARHEELGKKVSVEIRLVNSSWKARDFDGEIFEIDHMIATAAYTMIKTVSAAQTHRYAGGGKDYSIVSADAKIGDVSGKFVMVRDEADSTSVYWTPDKHG